MRTDRNGMNCLFLFSETKVMWLNNEQKGNDIRIPEISVSYSHSRTCF